ncbi:MAG: 4'-phosphopantetheinyl transferase family protein [Bacillota bacterium]
MEIYGVCLSNEHKTLSQLEFTTNKTPTNNDKAALTTIVSDIFLRAIICDKLEISNKLINFSVNEYGKPFLQNYNDFHFNISHSGEWIVCAIDQFPIGIDIEFIRPVNLYIVKRFFTEEEYMDIKKRSHSEQVDYFFSLWTLKESYVKAVGKGLSLPFNSFSIKVSSENISIKKDNEFSEKVFFKQYYTEKNYKLSVCALNDNFPDSINVVDFDYILDFLKQST